MKKFFTLVFIGAYGMNLAAQYCGPLDLSFGIDGKATGIMGPALDSRNIIVQPDNKIVQIISVQGSNDYDFGVIRYKSEGQLDSSFGTNGKVTTAVGFGASFSRAGALQADGKIVVVGQAMYSTYNSGFAVIRYNSNGRLDSSFGTNGKVITMVGPNYDFATALAIQSDGKIVVVGKSMDNYWTGAFAIVRYNSNGSIDATFAQNGKAVFHLGPFIAEIGGQYYGRYADETANAVSLQTDGKIVVAGTSYTAQGCYDYYGGIYCNPAFAMSRFNSTGTVDGTFGNNGKVADSSILLWATTMAMQSDDKIVVTGGGYVNGFITKRYNSDGSIDNGFGNSGTVISQTAGINVYHSSNAIAVKSDGKILIAGSLNVNNNSMYAVLRYTAAGKPDSSFNATASVFFKLGQPGSYEGATSVALQGNKILVAGNVRDNNNNSVVVVRLHEAGQLITPIITADGPLSFCDGGMVKLTSSETGAVQWYRNNLSISGATSTVYNATSSGSYTVSVNNAVGCGVSSPVSVTAVSLDRPSITANGDVAFCVGGSVLLYSDAFGGNQWYKDGVAILDSTANSLRVNTTGIYTVRVHLYGCESPESNPIGVTVNNIIPDAPSITANGNTTFCSGATVVLTSNSGSNNQWYLNGLPITGATTTSIQASVGGSYTAKVIVLGCASISSNVIDVTVNTSPPKPPLNWDGTKFSTNSGYAHYQWYQNDTAISGATTDTYTPGLTQFGDYKVVVTDNNNCFSTSDKKPYRVTAVSEIALGDATLRCYPNPAKASLNVDVSAMGIRKLQAALYDVSARLLQKQLLNQYHNVMDIQRIPAGLYQLVVDNGIEKTAIKVIVIK